MIARDFLEKQGYRFEAMQWRTTFGEIDLIMWDRDELVFVEVKLRSTNDFGHPEEMISREKMKKIQRTAYHYLRFGRYQEIFWRFDFISITGDHEHYEIVHLKDTIRSDRLH